MTNGNMGRGGGDNPFRAPAARVADVGAKEGELIEDGRRVPTGNAWGWIVRGWELFRAAPGMWIGITVAWITIMIVLGLIPILNIITNFLSPVFIGGIMLGCKALDEGDPLEFSHLFAGFRNNTGNLVLVGVLYLVGLIAVFMLLGLVGAALLGLSSTGLEGEGFGPQMGLPMVLLVLLGMLFVIPLAMALWFAPALVALHDVPAFPAMRMSFLASVKNFLPFLFYGLILLVLAVLASLPVFLGWLILSPVMTASIYASYRDMFVQD